jgi:holo-[acyl-carrier-protein] synthase
MEKKRFLDRVYTMREQSYAHGCGKGAAAAFAARFAGKEAVMKAFGTGLRGGTLHDIEILPDALGAPQVMLTGYFSDLARQRGASKVWISLSHEQAYAVAYCLLEE